MNSFTITMYKYVIRMTIWALLGVWTASVSLESHPLNKVDISNNALFMISLEFFCLSLWWHYTKLKEKEALSGSEMERIIPGWSWTVCGTAVWSSFWSTSELDLPIWQIRWWSICWQVTFALGLSHRWATSCHSVLFCLKKCPLLLLIRDLRHTEQQVNHVRLAGDGTHWKVWKVVLHSNVTLCTH